MDTGTGTTGIGMCLVRITGYLVRCQMWILVKAELPGIMAILHIHIPHMAQQAPNILLAQPSGAAKVHKQQVEAHPNPITDNVLG
jgi:hypothetical protein